MKKIAIVVSSKNFRDEEYFIPREVFEREGFSCSVFSDKKGVIIGAYGGEGIADEKITRLNPENFAALVFVGGQGALKLLDNEISYEVIRKAAKKDILLGAICISPVILAKAGVLREKEATVWSSPMDKEGIRVIEKEGGVYKKEEVVKSGRIITASGPEVAEQFAEKIVEELQYLTKKEKKI